jgi:hypothetical protein
VRKFRSLLETLLKSNMNTKFCIVSEVLLLGRARCGRRAARLRLRRRRFKRRFKRSVFSKPSLLRAPAEGLILRAREGGTRTRWTTLTHVGRAAPQSGAATRRQSGAGRVSPSRAAAPAQRVGASVGAALGAQGPTLSKTKDGRQAGTPRRQSILSCAWTRSKRARLRRPFAQRPGKEAVAVHLFREPSKEASWEAPQAWAHSLKPDAPAHVSVRLCAACGGGVGAQPRASTAASTDGCFYRWHATQLGRTWEDHVPLLPWPDT